MSTTAQRRILTLKKVLLEVPKEPTGKVVDLRAEAYKKLRLIEESGIKSDETGE